MNDSVILRTYGNWKRRRSSTSAMVTICNRGGRLVVSKVLIHNRMITTNETKDPSRMAWIGFMQRGRLRTLRIRIRNAADRFSLRGPAEIYTGIDERWRGIAFYIPTPLHSRAINSNSLSFPFPSRLFPIPIQNIILSNFHGILISIKNLFQFSQSSLIQTVIKTQLPYSENALQLTTRSYQSINVSLWLVSSKF